MLNKALLLASGKKKGEPTLTVKWDSFPVNDEYSVSLTLQKADYGLEVIPLDGLDGSKGLSFPLALIKEKPTADGNFHISNSKMVYGFNSLYVYESENVFYTESLDPYDDYIYFTIISFDKDAMVDIQIY